MVTYAYKRDKLLIGILLAPDTHTGDAEKENDAIKPFKQTALIKSL